MESKPHDQGPIPVAPKTPENWDFENHFKEYLLLLASKGSPALETSSNYPKIISLSTSWHETLNDMRETTKKDGREKWAFAGVKEGSRTISLPTVPIKGEYDHVPGETMTKMMNWAKDKHGISHFLGDIHSHPENYGINFVKEVFEKENNLIEVFSAEDFYALIVSPNMYFMGLVAGDYNVYAFKTKESTGLGVDRRGFNQKDFSKYWYKKFGFMYIEKTHGLLDGGIIPLSLQASLRKVNLAIAERHKLILYQGRANQKLTKVFPK